MSAALERLREIIDERARLDKEERELLDQLANGGGAAQVADHPEVEPELSALVTLADAAQELGIEYDTVRMRARRARAAHRLADRCYVFRAWLDAQKKSKCSVVRSVAVRSEHVIPFAGKVEPR